MEKLLKKYGKIALKTSKFAPQLRARCKVVAYKFGQNFFCLRNSKTEAVCVPVTREYC